MKLKAYRNSLIRSRLEKASAAWLSNHPKRSFQEPEAISVPQMLRGLLYGSLFALFCFVLWTTRETGPLLISLALPVLAIRTFLKIHQIHSRPFSSETLRLLPLSNALLTRQVRLDQRPLLIEGLIVSTIIGMMGQIPSQTPVGIITAPLVYLSLVGLLQLACYWKFFEIFVFTIKAFIAFFLAGLVFEPVKRLGFEIICATPWFQAFQSPLTLVLLLAAGLTTAWLSRARWNKINHLDRSRFYETPSPEDPEIHEVEAVGPTSSRIPAPTRPIGKLEQIIWSFLSPKEKALSKAFDAHPPAFLKTWVKATTTLCLLLWLARFDWPLGLDSHKILLTVVATVMMGGIHLFGSLPVIQSLRPVVISPDHTSPFFQVFPITLDAIEKLIWKQGAPRFVLLALTFTLASLTAPQTETTLETLPVIFLIALVFIAHLSWMFAWNQSINGWIPRRKRGKGWVILIELTLLLGILFSLGSGVFVYSVFQGGGLVRLLGSGGLFVAIIIAYQVILRSLIRAFITDPKSDLIGQA